MTKNVAIERQGPVGLVTLTRPERHNAFDDALIAELTDALRTMEAEEGIRVVVLSSVGRSFSDADLQRHHAFHLPGAHPRHPGQRQPARQSLRGRRPTDAGDQ